MKRFFTIAFALLLPVTLFACAKTIPMEQPESKQNGDNVSAPLQEEKTPEAQETTQPLWELEPQFSYDEVIPLYSDHSKTAGDGLTSGYYAVSKDGAWGLWNGNTQQPVIEGAFGSAPFLTSLDGLYSSQIYDESTVIAALDSGSTPFGLYMPSGNPSYLWVLDPSNNEVSCAYCDVGPSLLYSLSEMDPHTLLAVQQGEINQEMECVFSVVGSGYAVATQQGELVTDFIYANALMANDTLIAVQDDSGNWGYCNAQGDLVIPCEYQAEMQLDVYGSAVDMPFPAMGSSVVVQDANGQDLLLDYNGDVLIEAGAYEALAPAENGTVWAKQDGLWGLLRYNS